MASHEQATGRAQHTDHPTAAPYGSVCVRIDAVGDDTALAGIQRPSNPIAYSELELFGTLDRACSCGNIRVRCLGGSDAAASAEEAAVHVVPE